MADSKLLQKVDILCGDFSKMEQYAGENTLFYFDPPYRPLSDTSSFNSYVKEPFDDAEQVRLRDFCNTIVQRGSRFLLSNSDVKGKNPSDNFLMNYILIIKFKEFGLLAWSMQTRKREEN